MAAVGVVGSGTRAESATNKMAISLAGAVRLPARYWGFSLHGFDVAAPDRMALGQVASPNPKHLLDFADAPWCCARLWIVRTSVACDS